MSEVVWESEVWVSELGLEVWEVESEVWGVHLNPRAAPDSHLNRCPSLDSFVFGLGDGLPHSYYHYQMES